MRSFVAAFVERCQLNRWNPAPRPGVLVGMKQPALALTYGVMAEIVMGVMLFVWSTAMPGDETAPLGHPLSFGVVVAAMIVLAVAMLFLLLATRLPKPLLMTTAAVEALAAGGVAAIAFALFITEPGLGLMLLAGCALAYPVIVQITRVRTGRN